MSPIYVDMFATAIKHRFPLSAGKIWHSRRSFAWERYNFWAESAIDSGKRLIKHKK